MRSQWVGWLLWISMAFGLFNLGLGHDQLREVRSRLHAGQRPGAIEAVRLYYTNDGDERRYWAYTQAALGRPYQSYFVRSAEKWRQSFAAAEPYRPDERPTVSPTRPLTPYRDYLVEYPPGFFLVAVPPALLTHQGDLYLLLFQSTMALLLTLAFIVAWRATRRFGPPVRLRSVLLWGALGALALGSVVTHRFDAAVALPIAVAAWAAVRRRPIVLGVALGLAIGFKGVPLLLVPIFLMHALRERRIRDFWQIGISTGLTTAVICLPSVLGAGTQIFGCLQYQKDRPIQIESTWGSILGLLHAVVPGAVTVERTFGSVNVVAGNLGPVAGVLSTLMTLGGACLVYVATWRRLATPSRARRARVTVIASVAVLALFMVGGKVCSPQYLVWILPFGICLCLTDARRRGLTPLIAVLLMTQIIYPITYSFLETLTPASCALVLVRNLLLIGWAVAPLLKLQTESARSLPAFGAVPLMEKTPGAAGWRPEIARSAMPLE